MRRWPLAVVLMASAVSVQASETVRYAPAPDWVAAAPAITAAQVGGDAPAIVLFDNQARLDGALATTYVDTATRAATPAMLAQMGNLSIPWMPDRGDLTIHRLEIVRDGKTIDLIAAGQKFTVLRREQQMEQNVLTGALTATLSVEGLQVGDVLRSSFSISQSDKALGARAMIVAMTPAAPFRAGFARSRLVWPRAQAAKWRGYAAGLATTERDVGDLHEVTVALPLPKAPDMPEDLPDRLRRLPIVEATNFADWADVSRTLAPLYATDGLIAPGSPLDREVAAIAAAESDPLRRAQRALELVQGKVRYLAVGMNGGALTPQPPARTWELRYGDCKAKTLLLLAMLHRLGVEAEPAVASVQMGAIVATRLPSAAAFDHILVRATIGGETLWLDGTGLGSRLEDIRDVPPLRHVLPLRTAGAVLEALPLRADARPDRIVEVKWDQRAGVEFPTLFDASIIIRGRMAEMFAGAASQADAEERRTTLQQIISAETGEGQFVAEDLRYDPATATATVTGRGVVTTPWQRENRRYRMNVDRVVSLLDFTPDRARQAWRDLPVSTGAPGGTMYRATWRLPDTGGAWELEGSRTLPATLAGRQMRRQVALDGGTFTIEERVDAIGAEVAPDALAAERARYAQALANLLRLKAPAALPNRAEQVLAGRKDGRFKPLEEAFAAVIARDPKEATGYSSRASFRAGLFDNSGAIADLSRAIELEDSVALRMQRAALYVEEERARDALADYRQARALEPDNDAVLLALAQATAHGGDRPAAYALLDERIARGDRERVDAVRTRAELMAEKAGGEADKGVALLDAVIAERPGDSRLLNGRCWVKGIGNVALDTALKDCTRSIELSDSPAATLHSRAFVYYRMQRFEEALADLDAAADLMPRSADVLYLRALTRRHLGRTAEATADMTAATLFDRQIAATYARYGVTG